MTPPPSRQRYPTPNSHLEQATGARHPRAPHHSHCTKSVQHDYTGSRACVAPKRRRGSYLVVDESSYPNLAIHSLGSRAPAVGEGRSGGGQITGGAWAQGGVRGRFPVKTGSCLHEQSAWCGVLEGVYPPGASTTAGSNYAHTRQRVASTFRDTVASAPKIAPVWLGKSICHAHCAPQHQRSHLCGWGRASAMHNKSALHMGCTYTQLVCLPWAETASKGGHC